MEIRRRVILENGEIVELPKLEKDDWKNKGADFWRNYRIALSKIIKYDERQDALNRIEKTPENIIEMAQKDGIKPTARYFNIEPCQVRYYIKKYNKSI